MSAHERLRARTVATRGMSQTSTSPDGPFLPAPRGVVLSGPELDAIVSEWDTAQAEIARLTKERDALVDEIRRILDQNHNSAADLATDIEYALPNAARPAGDGETER